MIVYTPLWETMKKKGITTYALINKHNISSSTINRLRHNMGVTTQLINDLCEILGCDVEDIMKYEKEDWYIPSDIIRRFFGFYLTNRYTGISVLNIITHIAIKIKS